MLQNQKQLTVRNSSIELLRIISMIMIVSCHFATHGAFSYGINSLLAPRLWWNFIEMGGNLGVDVFVLISGYFLVTSKGIVFNTKRILKFWGQVFVYSISIYLVFCVIGRQKFELVSFVKALFPITFGAWWFASTYFVLYLVHPFMNMLLQKLEKNTYQALIAMQLIMWCIIPTFTTSDYQGNNLLWFMTLYCVAGYVRIYGLNPRFTTKSYLGFWVFFSALRYLSCVFLMMLGTRIPLAAKHSLHFYDKQSVLTFLCALSLFMAFEKCSIGHIKWINAVASATFGVYLIHDNSIIRHLLWQVVFQNAKYQDSMLLIPYSIIVVAIVYVACTIIELLRQHIIERPFLLMANRLAETIIRPLELLSNYVRSLAFGREN